MLTKPHTVHNHTQFLILIGVDFIVSGLWCVYLCIESGHKYTGKHKTCTMAQTFAFRTQDDRRRWLSNKYIVGNNLFMYDESKEILEPSRQLVGHQGAKLTSIELVGFKSINQEFVYHLFQFFAPTIIVPNSCEWQGITITGTPVPADDTKQSYSVPHAMLYEIDQVYAILKKSIVNVGERSNKEWCEMVFEMLYDNGVERYNYTAWHVSSLLHLHTYSKYTNLINVYLDMERDAVEAAKQRERAQITIPTIDRKARAAITDVEKAAKDVGGAVETGFRRVEHSKEVEYVEAKARGVEHDLKKDWRRVENSNEGRRIEKEAHVIEHDIEADVHDVENNVRTFGSNLLDMIRGDTIPGRT